MQVAKETVPGSVVLQHKAQFVSFVFMVFK